jgi:hypothetical protein
MLNFLVAQVANYIPRNQCAILVFVYPGVSPKGILCHCEESASGGRRSDLLGVVNIEKAMRLLRFARNDIEDSSLSHLGVEEHSRNEIQI